MFISFEYFSCLWLIYVWYLNGFTLDVIPKRYDTITIEYTLLSKKFMVRYIGMVRDKKLQWSNPMTYLMKKPKRKIDISRVESPLGISDLEWINQNGSMISSHVSK